jgi:hypothetical protein
MITIIICIHNISKSYLDKNCSILLISLQSHSSLLHRIKAWYSHASILLLLTSPWSSTVAFIHTRYKSKKSRQPHRPLHSILHHIHHFISLQPLHPTTVIKSSQPQKRQSHYSSASLHLLQWSFRHNMPYSLIIPDSRPSFLPWHIIVHSWSFEILPSAIFNNSSVDVIIIFYYFSPFLLIAVKVPMNAIAARK